LKAIVGDWGGRLERRFRWRHLRFEWGRWNYETDCCGGTVRHWWVWESDNVANT